MFIGVIVPVFCAGVYLIINMNQILQTSVVNEAFSDVETIQKRLKDTIYTTSAAAETVYYDNAVNELINNNFTTTKEYREFYQIARNYQKRSLNVDACSLFFYGLLRDKNKKSPIVEKLNEQDNTAQLTFFEI